jgi:hypothetical protein
MTTKEQMKRKTPTEKEVLATAKKMLRESGMAKAFGWENNPCWLQAGAVVRTAFKSAARYHLTHK